MTKLYHVTATCFNDVSIRCFDFCHDMNFNVMSSLSTTVTYNRHDAILFVVTRATMTVYFIPEHGQNFKFYSLFNLYHDGHIFCRGNTARHGVEFFFVTAESLLTTLYIELQVNKFAEIYPRFRYY